LLRERGDTSRSGASARGGHGAIGGFPVGA
jgi:hypothetical protein